MERGYSIINLNHKINIEGIYAKAPLYLLLSVAIVAGFMAKIRALKSFFVNTK